MQIRKFLMLEGTPGAPAAGPAAPAASAAPVAAPATPAATASPAAAPATPAATASPAPAPSALMNQAKPSEFIPEKFRVMNGDVLDVEGSARKMAESYTQLEGRVGSGDVPPKTADEYKVAVPEAFKDAWVEDDRSKAFKAEALANGLTQKQFDFVMGNYFKMAPTLIEGGMANSLEAVKGNLTKAWGAEYDKNFNAAYAAFEAFADPGDKGKFDSIMSDPSLAYRLLAKIGPELGEAPGIPGDAGGGQPDDITALLTSEAANNPKHADHKATRAKLDAHYAKKYGNAAVN